METICRFPSCNWSGDMNALLNHCDSKHQKFVKDIKDGDFFNFSLENVLKDTFLLYTSKGIYWFLLSDVLSKSCIRRGIFAIGDSVTYEYTVRLGGADTVSVAYLGPYKTRSSDSKKFDLKLTLQHLEYFRGFIASKNVTLYFGEDDKKNMGTHL